MTMGPAPYNLVLSRRNYGAHTAHPLRVKKMLEWHEQSISRGGEGYMSAAAYKLLQDGGFCLAFDMEVTAVRSGSIALFGLDGLLICRFTAPYRRLALPLALSSHFFD